MADLNFDDFMFKALLHDRQEESRREQLKRNGCPETIHGHHSEPNSSGNCLFCGKNIYKRSRPLPPLDYRSELDLAYHYFYDPDFGNDRTDKY